MAKAKTTAFFCSECGYESSKWMGQCPACKAWNTLVEEPAAGSARSASSSGRLSAVSGIGAGKREKAALLSEISLEEEDRISTGFKELDRVLGDGIVAGSLILVGGDPGIGKSTLLLQVCRQLAADGKKVLYISGEESLKQIKMRACRIGSVTGDLRFLCETNLDRISQAIDLEKPQIVVIDSIQTMYREEISSAPGSVSQVKESTGLLMQIAKSRGIAIFVVGHVTKEGVVAGPRVLEHMVDCVLYFEGDQHMSYRILRAAKNRFGATNEIGVFEMADKGLAEVANPSETLLSGRPQDAPGTCVTCAMEGARPVLAEIQALIAPTAYANPRRTSNGLDYNRSAMLMAVLEKRGGLKISNCDAYLNVIGGLSLDEPAADLAIMIALASSYLDAPVGSDLAAIGEVGLTGELRSVQSIGQRLCEVQRLGFHKCVVPWQKTDKLTGLDNLELIRVKTIGQALQAVLGK